MNRRPLRAACVIFAAGLPSVAAAGTRPKVQLRTSAVPASMIITSPGRPSADWPKYCADPAMTGVAAAEGRISPAAVSGMELLWTDTLSGPIASSPIVVGERVYVGDWSGTEWVVAASTGAAVATADLGRTTAPQCAPPVIGITSAPNVVDGVAYVAGGDDSFYALDAATLALRWKTRLGDNSAQGGYYGWCSPVVDGDLVYQGVSSNCDNPFIPGELVALGAASGAPMASANFAEPALSTNPGGGVWSSPAVDVEGNGVFVTTASSISYWDGLSYSIVRLSRGDLAVRDAWKITLDDFAISPDADWGSSPTLFSDSAGKRLVGAGQKNGYYYAFRRDDLAAGPVWKTEVAVGGECPQCGHGTISTAAFDGRRLYVGAGIPPDSSAPGTVYALDPATGAILWRYAAAGPVLAPISYANGVVFAAGGRRCVALDAETGEPLWSYDAAGNLYGGIAISRGKIYFGDIAGNLYAFGFPSPPG